MIAGKREIGVIVLLISTVVFTSCASKRIGNEYVREYVRPDPSLQKPKRDYVLAPGDTIKVEFYYNEKLNRQLIIRPDGKITLPLKGEIEASGLTPNELRGRIMNLFADVLKDPVVTVTVEGLSKSNVVYVMGEVQKPDYYQIDLPTTVTQLLARAGVVTSTANLDTVLVISRDEEGRPLGQLINVRDILDKGNLDQDLLLKKYDVVYVSRSAIAKADLFVEQYINRLIPNFFRINYTFGNTNNR